MQPHHDKIKKHTHQAHTSEVEEMDVEVQGTSTETLIKETKMYNPA